MTPLSIKVCGMTEAENIREVEQLGVDMIGFIFYPKSPRCLCELPDYLPVHAKRVGVFVNENKENILMYADRFALDYIQLHGDESPEYCRSLCNNGLHLIKAFSISHPKDLMCTSAYKGLCSVRHQNPAIWRFRQPVRLEPAVSLWRNDPFSAQRRNQPVQHQSNQRVSSSQTGRHRHQ